MMPPSFILESYLCVSTLFDRANTRKILIHAQWCQRDRDAPQNLRVRCIKPGVSTTTKRLPWRWAGSRNTGSNRAVHDLRSWPTRTTFSPIKLSMNQCRQNKPFQSTFNTGHNGGKYTVLFPTPVRPITLESPSVEITRPDEEKVSSYIRTVLVMMSVFFPSIWQNILPFDLLRPLSHSAMAVRITEYECFLFEMQTWKWNSRSLSGRT